MGYRIPRCFQSTNQRIHGVQPPQGSASVAALLTRLGPTARGTTLINHGPWFLTTYKLGWSSKYSSCIEAFGSFPCFNGTIGSSSAPRSRRLDRWRVASSRSGDWNSKSLKIRFEVMFVGHLLLAGAKGNELKELEVFESFSKSKLS